MKKIFAYIGSIFLLSSCQLSEFRGEELLLNPAVKITSFAVNGTQGVIDDKAGTIALTMPFGSSFSTVQPVISLSEGAAVTPASGEPVNLKESRKYRVTNGNIYGDYTVTAAEKSVLLSFTVGGVNAEIDHQARTIYAVVPDEVNIAALSPVIGLSSGASVTPASGTAVNFTAPRPFTITDAGASVIYTVTVVRRSSVARLAFLGTAANANGLTQADEKTAFDWMKASFPNVDYISFNAIKAGTADLANYKVIWWHEDATQALPSIAFDADIIAKMKNYRTKGGAFLLSSYGVQYVEALGIVPAGKGPNNTFGDNTPWLEASWDWGISYKNTAAHAAFQGLALTPDKPFPTAYLLAKNTFRLNHSSIWKVNEWGGYGSIANWKTETGGINLASTEWDEDHTNHVTIAEFPRKSNTGPVIVIGAGAYDWYVEANPENGNPGNPNLFKPNVERLTRNSINYLSN